MGRIPITGFLLPQRREEIPVPAYRSGDTRWHRRTGGFCICYPWRVGSRRSRARVCWADREKKFRASSDLFWNLALLVIIVAFETIRGSKGWILRPFFYGMILYHYRTRQVGILKTVGCGLGIFCVSIFFLLSQRVFGYDFVATWEFLKASLDSPGQVFNMLLGRFYGLDSLIVCLRLVRSSGHFLWGSSFTELLYWFIPRAIWPNKPSSFSYRFSSPFSFYTGSGGNAFDTPSFFGEFYLNFGICGIIIGAIAFGVLARTIYEYLVVRGSTNRAILLYGVLLLHFMFFVEGPVAVQVALMCSELLPLLILFLLSSFRPVHAQSLVPSHLAHRS